MNIVIVHVKRSGLKVSPFFNIGRPSPLGNPYSHLDESKASVKVDTVDEAVHYYGKWLALNYREPEVYEELKRIYKAAKTHPVIYIGCWCMDELDPKPYDHSCHCTMVRKALLNRYKRETSNDYNDH